MIAHKEIIKFELLKSGSVVIKNVYIDSEGPLAFLVTTDSPKTIVDKGLAERMGLELRGPYEGVEAGGKVLHYTTILKSFRIGWSTLRDLEVTVSDFSLISDNFKEKIAGAITSDILRRYRAIIDYGKEQITLQVEE